MASNAHWWTGEDPIRVSCIPRHVPATADGKPVSVSTAYRWTKEGVRGVVLRRFRFGWQWFTTRQELARWQAALTAAS